MALTEVLEYVRLLPGLRRLKQNNVWLSYDEGADVLYINYEKPSLATDSNLTEDGIIIRYRGKKVIGMTVLNAAARIGN